MELGVFSVSLAVNDLEASRRFYEAFGFRVFGVDISTPQPRAWPAGLDKALVISRLGLLLI